MDQSLLGESVQTYFSTSLIFDFWFFLDELFWTNFLANHSFWLLHYRAWQTITPRSWTCDTSNLEPYLPLRCFVLHFHSVLFFVFHLRRSYYEFKDPRYKWAAHGEQRRCTGKRGKEGRELGFAADAIVGSPISRAWSITTLSWLSRTRECVPVRVRQNRVPVLSVIGCVQRRMNRALTSPSCPRKIIYSTGTSKPILVWFN